VERNETAPFVLVYQFTYSVWITVALLSFAIPSWRYGRLSTDPCARIGIGLLIPLGIAFGLAALAVDLLYGLAVRVHAAYVLWVDPVVIYSGLSLLGFLALCAGSTMPAWGPRLGVPGVYMWVRRYVLYQRMYPLWLTLYKSCPWIALVPPRSRMVGILNGSDLDFRFYRRIVEIYDGRLAVQNFGDPDVDLAALQVCKEGCIAENQHDRVVAAAALLNSSESKRAGHRRARPSLAAIPAASDVEGEAIVLGDIAQHCANDALMSRIEALVKTRRPQAVASSRRP